MYTFRISGFIRKCLRVKHQIPEFLKIVGRVKSERIKQFHATLSTFNADRLAPTGRRIVVWLTAGRSSVNWFYISNIDRKWWTTLPFATEMHFRWLDRLNASFGFNNSWNAQNDMRSATPRIFSRLLNFRFSSLRWKDRLGFDQLMP